MTRRLPEPALTRWQPLRAGLVDLFYYDTEEFWFRDGRLLLRGNNGTGKSKVLALMLPFLLDGDLSPHRVEPDADPKKKMEWNLLLGGAHPYPERLGYTWLEFGRIDEDGEPRFHTLGCGMKAVSGKGIARHWYFVTEQRVGAGLELLDATGTALSRDRLGDALGEHGTIYDRARNYRRAVDEALFGFGEQRYGALVDLLVQLRQPQLSKRPSEKALSAALTEALPPLDQAVVADVAEAFRSLEEDRESLRAMNEAHDAAKSFLGHYSRYARIASRRRAARPRSAQAEYRRVSENLAAAETAYQVAETALTTAKARLEELGTERKRLQARDEALRASPEMRSARELERAAEDARKLTERAGQLAGERTHAITKLATRRERHERAGSRLASARANLDTARVAAREAAELARITGPHTERIDGALTGSPDLARLRAGAEQLATRQKDAIDQVHALIRAAGKALGELAEARRKVDELDAEADDLAQRRTGAATTVTERGTELVTGVRRHLDAAIELRLADPAATLAELELWVETLDGPNPATAAAAATGQTAAAALARADAAREAEERAARLRLDELAAEIERLERGDHNAPPVPYTRQNTDRVDRAGAPFWQLVDFSAEVEPAARAGLEAALEGAGILDAWVTPAGELLAPDTEDVVLVPRGQAGGASLATALIPAVDRENPHANAVSEETVAELLGSIGLGENSDTWVRVDGAYRVGVLTGSWHKPAAEYVGRGAREAARRARLATLRAELSTVESQLDELAEARRVLHARQVTLAAEVSGLPGDEALREAHSDVKRLAEEAQRLVAKQSIAAETVRLATERAETAQVTLDEGATDAGLPATAAELSEVESGLNAYRTALAGLWPTAGLVTEAGREADEAAGELEEAELHLTDVAERSATAEHEAAGATERHRTLRETVGAAVAELEAHLAEVAKALRTNEADAETAGRERDAAINARGKADGRRETLKDELEAATAERASAADSLRRFAATGLLAIALPDLAVPDPGEPWAPDPTVRLARRINDELADLPDDDNAWDRAQKRVNDELKTLTDTLSRQGSKASGDLLEDGLVVEVEFRGKPATVPELTSALGTEVGDRERLLSEREREILENHLINEVASTLQELISAAEAQVARMNDELDDRPTSTGMRLRLQWKPREDGPAGLAAARERLLRQTADAWSEADRAAVGGFLQARIAEVRARDASGTWLEHLTEALDYRAWNRFVIQRHQNGQWKPATGPASGGERVLAASVPLFAAASSHYASAGSPHAPRLVTLDEAFAGVDDNARAKYLGLLAAFDLDVVMTSEREWGCYPEVPGLAISQLSRVDGVNAVLVTNWAWDGHRRSKLERPAAVAEPEPVAAATDGLWD
ncbi:TIGR02680 family protein [Amycolatopsis balhimycina DSM 5908]|uniref:TIGR02680 family protein n=1 Tax=Amycolatopsis balhimycina DSM 5908 TaxID=1081091 RepID=A0A428WQY0_AMYBA|nr:TIGR02680 family protein [Amycolatopsis balhimycina]RSM45497.1 TIGR02680 family protein [Amycolatopsis balhimycina DSM 5908]